MSMPLLTTAEVAALLQVPVRRVRRLGLPVVLLGPRTYRYSAAAVDAYLEARTQGGLSPRGGPRLELIRRGGHV